MILSGLEIKNRIGKDIEIDPYNENQINPNSYNLKLHNELLVYKDKIFDMKKPLNTQKIIIPKIFLDANIAPILTNCPQNGSKMTQNGVIW